VRDLLLFLADYPVIPLPIRSFQPGHYRHVVMALPVAGDSVSRIPSGGPVGPRDYMAGIDYYKLAGRVPGLTAYLAATPRPQQYNPPPEPVAFGYQPVNCRFFGVSFHKVSDTYY